MDAPGKPVSSAPAWTVGRLLGWTQEHFTARGVDQPRLSAELLLAEALACRKIDLYVSFERVPTEEQRGRFRQLVMRAAEHTPISYLLGRREFFSLEFAVTPDVLIPRPETETLVERSLAWLKTLTGDVVQVFDMGTGSGCIAVAIARYEPRARVVASDVSAAALEVAAANAARHGVADRVRPVEADATRLPPGVVPSGGFDLIVSNPPYIADAAVDGLAATVRDYEPRLALAAGDGLAFYRRLSAEGADLVRRAGRCYVEIGLGQAEAVARLFTATGQFRVVGVWKDLGGLERVVGLERTA